MASALGVAHTDQPAIEVHVVPVQAEQLRTAQPAISEQGEQQPVTLHLSGMNSRPDTLAGRNIQKPRELLAVEHVRQRFALLRRAQYVRRVTVQMLALHTEAKEALHGRHGPRLARRCGSVRRLIGQEAAQVSGANLNQGADPLTSQKLDAGAHIALIRLARQVGQTPLHTAENDEVRQGVLHRGLRFRAGPRALWLHP